MHLSHTSLLPNLVTALANRQISGVLYATTLRSASSKHLLEAAISSFLKIAENGDGKLLYNWYYEQQPQGSALDLAFDDQILDDVEVQWKSIIQPGNDLKFMQFEERNAVGDDEDEDNEGY